MPLSIVNAIAIQPTDSNVILAGVQGPATAAATCQERASGVQWTRA